VPRVSEEYRARRRAEILTGAARCFARDGFHSTSMAAIIAETGLSAGVVYRYFRSKDEVIAGVAEMTLSAADTLFRSLLADGATPSPQDTVHAMVNGIVERAAHDPTTGVDLTRIAIQVWAETTRNPELHARTDAAFVRLRNHCTEIVRRWQAADNISADVKPEHVAAAIIGMAQGFWLQRVVTASTTADDYLAGVRALLVV
jgi:AcrR family transcriptional regulator